MPLGGCRNYWRFSSFKYNKLFKQSEIMVESIRPADQRQSNEDEGALQTLLNSERVVKQELVKEELRCRICLGILWEPKECKVCETCFCGSCLDQWLSSDNNRCPLKCGDEPRFKDRPHKLIRNMLSELTFRCKNSHSGCQDELEYMKVFDHEQACLFDLQDCQGRADGCLIRLLKRDIFIHEQTCLFVPVECEYCRKRVKRSGLSSHFMACEEAEVECEMCKGIFKKKNYPLHVSALCEENIMSCGRCSGTYKRKYKEYHDCVRHLQNCQKTMGEEISLLKEKLNERDKRIGELESRIFYEMADLRAQIFKRDEACPELSRSASTLSESGTRFRSPVAHISTKWVAETSKYFKITQGADYSEASFSLRDAERRLKPQDMVFGFTFSQNSLVPISMTHLLELEINLQNITTSFIPMYYIIGVVPKQDLSQLSNLDTFDSIYSLLANSCSFVPSFGKCFQEKLKYCIRQRPIKKDFTEESKESDEVRFEVEDMEKQVKVKSIQASEQQEMHLFFGVYCSQNVHLSNHKEIKIRILS